MYKKLQGHEYEPIQSDENVNLEEPGIEQFKVIRKQELTFKVDDEDYTTSELDLTPLEIFGIIGLEPSKYYLKQLEGHIDITYKEDENKKIRMLGALVFITCKREPTTVS